MDRWSAVLALLALSSLGFTTMSGAGVPDGKAEPNAASDLRPEPESVDPGGCPESQINDKPARFHVFRVKGPWHVISTSFDLDPGGAKQPRNRVFIGRQSCRGPEL